MKSIAVALLALLAACAETSGPSLDYLPGVCFEGERVSCPKCDSGWGTCVDYRGACECNVEPVDFDDVTPDETTETEEGISE